MPSLHSSVCWAFAHGVPPMPSHAGWLAAIRLAGVAPEVNLRECVTCMPPPSANKAEPTLALKPRLDVTTKRTHVLQINKKIYICI